MRVSSPGFYIASHPWYSLVSSSRIGRPDTLFKVGHSGDLSRRIHDSCYTTAFSDEWSYRFVLECDTKESAEAVEQAMLKQFQSARLDGRELILGFTLTQLKQWATKIAARLAIAITGVDAPLYERPPSPISQSVVAVPRINSRPVEERLERSCIEEFLDYWVGKQSTGDVEDFLESLHVASAVPETITVMKTAPVAAAIAIPVMISSTPDIGDELLASVDFSTEPDVLEAIEITDREYQDVGISRCLEELQKHKRTLLQVACRCGKTKIAHGIMMSYFAADPLVRIAYQVPGLPLLRQTVQKLLMYGGDLFNLDNILLIGSDPAVIRFADGSSASMTTDPTTVRAFLAVTDQPRLVICMYQSSQLLPIGPTSGFALHVFDEAHKITGSMETRPSNRVALSTGNEHRLFMTATPDFSTKNKLSMSNRRIFGGVAYRYYLRQGIEAGYVNDFRLCLVAASSTEKNPLATQIMAAMSEPGMDKLLVFCKNSTKAVDDAARTVGAVAAEAGADFETLRMHSKMKHHEQKDAFQKFAADGQRSALFNCRMFQEGVEIKMLNGVFFGAPRHSARDIIQSMCRPLNRVDGKPQSVIFLPIIVDDVSKTKRVAGDQYDLGRFADIVPVFDALASEDPRLYEYLVNPDNNFPIDLIGTKSLSLTTLADKRELLRAVRKATRYTAGGSKRHLLKNEGIQWEYGISEIERIIKEKNRYPITGEKSAYGEEKIDIHSFCRKWCGTQYDLFKRGKNCLLEPHQLRRLEQLPKWDPFGIEGPYPWRYCQTVLKRYMEENKGDVPMICLSKRECVFLDATDIERLCGHLRVINMQDMSSDCRVDKNKQEELDALFGRFGKSWRKGRNPDGTLNKTKTSSIQDAGKRLTKYYNDWKKSINDGAYITKWFTHGQFPIPGTPQKKATGAKSA